MGKSILLALLIFFGVCFNSFAQNKARLYTIKKSIIDKSFEFYNDTVFFTGVAKYTLKKMLSPTKLTYRNLCDLKGNVLCQINLYSNLKNEQVTIPFSKLTSYVFWIKFNGINEDVRFINKEGDVLTNSKTKELDPVNDGTFEDNSHELALIKYLTQNNIISEKGINKTKAEEFTNKYKATKFVCSIRNECNAGNENVRFEGKEEGFFDHIFLTRKTQTIAVALGDKLYLDAGFNGELVDELEITKIIKSIVVSDKCKFAVQ